MLFVPRGGVLGHGYLATFVDRKPCICRSCCYYTVSYHDHTSKRSRHPNATSSYDSGVMFPASVEQVTLTRTKQGQQKVRPKFLPGHIAPLDPNEPEANVGVGGPILDFGREGAVRLDNTKGVWKWDWIKNQESSGSVVETGEGAVLYPRNRSLEPEVASLPPTKIANAAVSSHNLDLQIGADGGRSTTFGHYLMYRNMPPYRTSS